MGKIVSYILDLDSPPPEWSRESQERYDSIRDEDIDYSDIPELDDEFFKNAKRVDEFYKDLEERKSPAPTIPSDSDIAA